MGIVSGVIGVIFKLNDMRLNDIATSFKDGAKDLIGRPQIHELLAVALLKPVVGSSHCAWVKGVQPLVVIALRAYSAAFCFSYSMFLLDKNMFSDLLSLITRNLSRLNQ